MSMQNRIRNVNFQGSDEEFEAVRDGVAAALAKVDALVTSRPNPSPLRAGGLVSVVNVGGSASAPTIDLVWVRCPLDPGQLVQYEAVAEAAIRGEKVGDAAVVLHRGEARDLGVADHTALAAALGF